MEHAFSLYIYIGVDELHVESQLFGSFTIKASLHRDSAEDICRKVLDYTKVSTAYMELYARYKTIRHFTVRYQSTNHVCLHLVMKRICVNKAALLQYVL